MSKEETPSINFVASLQETSGMLLGGVWFLEAELEGVLDQELSRFRTASDAQKDRPITDDKTCFVALSKHDVSAVLQYAKDPNVRKRLYIANHSKLRENVDIFKQVALLRDANARQLGYSSHAAFRLESRLAKTTGWVYDFMDRLEEALLPKGARELDELLTLKATKTLPQEHDDAEARILLAWDYPYWERLALEAISVDHDKIAEYFPLKVVVQRMLDLFSHCLQMLFCKVPSPMVWAPEVEAWEVWDNRPEKGQDFVGYLYMDLVFRQNKHRGCQNVNLQPVSKASMAIRVCSDMR